MERYSKQRDDIWNSILSLNHPTMEDIINSVHENYPKIGIATVYRNVKQFLEDGLLQKIFINNIEYLDYNISGHYHFYCYKCRKLTDVDIPYNNEFDKLLDNGSIVENHVVVFRGLCKNCIKNNLEEN